MTLRPAPHDGTRAKVMRALERNNGSPSPRPSPPRGRGRTRGSAT
jgi:hypothetical protein